MIQATAPLLRGNTKVTVTNKASGNAYATIATSVQEWNYIEGSEGDEDEGEDGEWAVLELTCTLSAALVMELKVADAEGDFVVDVSWLDADGKPQVANRFTCFEIIIGTTLSGSTDGIDPEPATIELMLLVNDADLLRPV